MKKILFLFLILTLAASCSGDGLSKVNDDSGMGKLTFSIPIINDEIVVMGSRASSSDPLTFTVNIYKSSGDLYASYPSFGDMPDVIEIESGTYVVEAYSGTFKAAEWDYPHYSGSTAVSVEAGQTAKAEINCMIDNVKLTVSYSERMKTTLKDIDVTATTLYDELEPTSSGILHYDVNELRAGWLASPYDEQIKLYIKGTNVNTGNLVSNSTVLSGVEARQWRKLSLDLKTSGDLDIEITVDDTIVEMPDENIVIPDDNDIIDNNGDDGNWDEDGEEEPTSDLPTIVGSAFGTADNNAPYNIDEVVEFNVDVHNVLDVQMESKDSEGITNLFLTIESDALKDILVSILGIEGEIDLANPDTEAEWYTMFQDPTIGILDPEVPIKGKTSHTFSVGGLMSLLGGLPGGVGAEHKFHIRLVDANGETAKTLTIALSNNS